MSDTNTYDAIVIGSGISGGWAAKELTEKGLKTLMLERGKDIVHIKDYKNANTPIWEVPDRNINTTKMIEDHPVLRRDYILNRMNLDWWANHKDSPYTEIKRFDWFRGYHVGGRSLMWGRQCYRLNVEDFEANGKQGIGIDWPVRYSDIAPWYSYVEKFIGVSGSRDGLSVLPDGEYLPPMDLTIVEKVVAERIKKHYKGNRHIIIGRAANLTQEHKGRTHCQFRNRCWLGCPFGAYFSTQSSTLPAAQQTGNLTLRPYSIVTQILYDKNTQKAIGVEVLDAETLKTYTYKAKVIFLNASTLNSAWVLMNSAKDVWEDGLGSSSGELGHNLMDHHFNIGASGIVEGFEDKYFYGRRPNGIYIPRYRNVNRDRRDYIRGFGYQGGSNRRSWKEQIAEFDMGIGAEFKEALTEPGAWKIGLFAFGEMLPYHANKIRINTNKKDKWGLSTLSIDCEIKENERKMRKDMENDAVEMLEHSGVKNVGAFDFGATPGGCIHEMGTARMGRDPKTSVVNKWNQVWDAKNVFVTDGSFMTSSSCVNPSLTYMAFTARAVDFAVKELKRRNL